VHLQDAADALFAVLGGVENRRALLELEKAQETSDGMTIGMRKRA